MVKKTPNTMNKNKLLDSIENISSGNLNVNTIAFIIIYLIIFTFIIILHHSMYTWTEELEKNGCECSDLWQRNVIHWVALILLIAIGINVVFLIANIKSKVFDVFRILASILQIFYIAFIFDYITKLKKLECKCSENWKREYGYISSIIYIVIYGIFLLSIISTILLFIFLKKK
jgi:hypothetical protein|tara:strand:+ start:139 stop:660 length:522 start_codon:yes stop_codon:yes gene_type:complete